jgi:methylated-DNA-[protein]-cysteine S-methyltransferase
MSIRHCIIETTLGPLTLVADDSALIGVYFPAHWHLSGRDSFGPAVDAADDPVFSETQRQLTEYLDGDRSEFDIPIRLHGNDFALRVWELLTQIPFGNTVTYGDLAATLADGSTPWQVGQAVGRNPISIIVPCHRVVGKDGNLTGYAGGLRRKRFLLDREESGSSLARLF